MNWTELIEAVAGRQELPKSTVQRVLDGMASEVLAQLESGEDVVLHRLGTVGTAERRPRVIRSIADDRRMLVGRRHVVVFRPAAAARRAAAQLSHLGWKDADHQAAWRLAETLVSDLDLYHADRAPSLPADTASDAIREACRTSFGALWDRVRRTYDSEVADTVRDANDYLADAARRRWGT